MPVMPESLCILSRGGVLNLEGIFLEMDSGPLEPGDLYVAEKNQGPKLLTVKSVNWDCGFVVPTTNDYCYNTIDCVKVREYVEHSSPSNLWKAIE